MNLKDVLKNAKVAPFKKAFKNMVQPIAQSMKLNNCDFGVIDLKTNLIQYGVQSTGEIVKTIPVGEFDTGDLKGGVEIKTEDISSLFNSILVSIENNFICVYMDSPSLGKIDFNYPLEK